jgi:hypothetical protein
MTLLWVFLKDHNFAHLLGSRRRTSYSLERKRKIFVRQASVSLSPPHAARLMQVSRGEKSGTIIEFSSPEGSAPPGGPTVPAGICITEKDAA